MASGKTLPRAAGRKSYIDTFFADESDAEARLNYVIINPACRVKTARYFYQSDS